MTRLSKNFIGPCDLARLGDAEPGPESDLKLCFKLLCVLMHACLLLCCRSSASSTEVKQILPSSTESLATEKAKTVGIKPIKQNSSNSMRPWDALDLAKKAVVASKAAAFLSESSFTFTAADLDGSLSHGLAFCYSSSSVWLEYGVS